MTDTCFGPMLILVVYYFTSEIGTTSLQGTKLLAPKCPLFGGSTVEVCTIQSDNTTKLCTLLVLLH